MTVNMSETCSSEKRRPRCCSSRPNSTSVGTYWTGLFASFYLKMDAFVIVLLSGIRIYNIFGRDGQPPITRVELGMPMVESLTSMTVSIAVLLGIKKNHAGLLLPFMAYHIQLIIMSAASILCYCKNPDKVVADLNNSFLRQFPALEDKIMTSDPVAMAAVVIAVLIITFALRLFFVTMSFRCFMEVMEIGDGPRKQGEETSSSTSAGKGKARVRAALTTSAEKGKARAGTAFTSAEKDTACVSLISAEKGKANVSDA